MKAILQYGQFTMMLEVPKHQYTISIMKPQDAPSYVPLDPSTIDELKTSRLEFRIDKELTEDIWLYRFVGEFWQT